MDPAPSRFLGSLDKYEFRPLNPLARFHPSGKTSSSLVDVPSRVLRSSDFLPGRGNIALVELSASLPFSSSLLSNYSKCSGFKATDILLDLISQRRMVQSTIVDRGEPNVLRDHSQRTDLPAGFPYRLDERRDTQRRKPKSDTPGRQTDPAIFPDQPCEKGKILL